MSATYGIGYWFNTLCKLWGEISVDGKRVNSYSMEKIPESVTTVPCAISFVESVDAGTSRGGPSHVVYHGVTHFHLTLSLVRSQMGFVLKFPDAIVKKAAEHITLNGMVTDFRIQNPGSVDVGQGTWGNEEEHFIVKVPWTVQENQTGKFTVGV